jgi:Flp pilus assembly protein TadG
VNLSKALNPQKQCVIKMIKKLINKFVKNESGAVLFEVAITFPLFMGLCFTGIEFVSFMNAHMKISQLNHMVADNTARVRDRITEASFEEILKQIEYNDVGKQLLEKGRVKISIVTTNTNTTANLTDNIILDQRCFGNKNFQATRGYGAKNAVLLNGIGPEGRRILATDNNAVIFVETYFDYDPVFFSEQLFADKFEFLNKQFLIHYTTAASVRDRRDHRIQQLTGIQPRAC